VLSTVRTNAAVGASPAGIPRSLPLVVLSPGFTNSRSTLSGLAEDLASHGFVVAGIDHTYESHATAFPDGRITTCLARSARRTDEGFKEKLVAGRAADVSFVLGELTDARPARPGAGLIDPSRIAMAGHSAGGAATIAAMRAARTPSNASPGLSYPAVTVKYMFDTNQPGPVLASAPPPADLDAPAAGPPLERLEAQICELAGVIRSR